MTLAELPDFLTVEEAAEILRVGRSRAYELTKLWRATGGQEGIPVVQLGRQLRVPKSWILKQLGLSNAA